jgi:hypothetical protein
MSCKPTYKGIRYNSLKELKSSVITPQQKRQAVSKFQEYVQTTGRQDIEGFKEFVNNTQEVEKENISLVPIEKPNPSFKQNRHKILKNNEEVGFIVTSDPKEGVVKILGVTVNEEKRGQGIAGDAYIKLNKLLAKSGAVLESDNFIDSMEPQAIRIWEKLLSQGLVEKLENTYRFNDAELKALESSLSVVDVKNQIGSNDIELLGEKLANEKDFDDPFARIKEINITESSSETKISSTFAKEQVFNKKTQEEIDNETKNCKL